MGWGAPHPCCGLLGCGGAGGPHPHPEAGPAPPRQPKGRRQNNPGPTPSSLPHPKQKLGLRFREGSRTGRAEGGGRWESRGRAASGQRPEGQRRCSQQLPRRLRSLLPETVLKQGGFEAHIPALLLRVRYEAPTRPCLTWAGRSQARARGRQVGRPSPEPRTDAFTERCAGKQPALQVGLVTHPTHPCEPICPQAGSQGPCPCWGPPGVGAALAGGGRGCPLKHQLQRALSGQKTGRGHWVWGAVGR